MKFTDKAIFEITATTAFSSIKSGDLEIGLEPPIQLHAYLSFSTGFASNFAAWSKNYKITPKVYCFDLLFTNQPKVDPQLLRELEIKRFYKHTHLISINLPKEEIEKGKCSRRTTKSPAPVRAPAPARIH